MPLVSVCIPTYNYANFLGQAVESVLGQTFSDFELIIVDDASTDDSAGVAEKFVGDPRLTFVRNEFNNGMFANFNASAQLATGRYLKYLCADDWLEPAYLERALELIEASPSATLLTCASVLSDDAGRTIGSQTPPFGKTGVVPAVDAVRMMARYLNVIGMPSNVLIRREAFDQNSGFDASFAPAADVHLWLKLLQQGDLAWLGEPLAHARMHEQHSHVYGTDPSDAPFRCWIDAKSWPGSNVDSTLLQMALDAEAERNTLHACADLLRGRFAHAREIHRYTSRYVRPSRFLARFFMKLPLNAFDQACRLLALSLGRQVSYRPRPRIGARKGA